MKTLLSSTLLICLLSLYFIACKKKDNNAFADALAASCTTAFVGAGDSTSLYLPTAFTPNGDGKNDVYRLLGLYGDFDNFLLTIYKTDGTQVFQETAPTSGWTGTDTSGVKYTDYKYYVKIKYTTTGGKSVDAGTYLYLLPTSSAGCVTAVPADKSNYKFADQFDYTTGLFSFTTNETFCN